MRERVCDFPSKGLLWPAYMKPALTRLCWCSARSAVAEAEVRAGNPPELLVGCWIRVTKPLKHSYLIWLPEERSCDPFPWQKSRWTNLKLMIRSCTLFYNMHSSWTFNSPWTPFAHDRVYLAWVVRATLPATMRFWSGCLCTSTVAWVLARSIEHSRHQRRQKGRPTPTMGTTENKEIAGCNYNHDMRLCWPTPSLMWLIWLG